MKNAKRSKINQMGQQEVYSFLKRNKTKWFSSRAVIEKLGASPGSAIMSLNKLRKGNTVQFKLQTVDGSTTRRRVYFYRYKK